MADESMTTEENPSSKETDFSSDLQPKAEKPLGKGAEPQVEHPKRVPENIIAGRNPVIEAFKAGTMIERVFILSGIKGGAIEKIRSLAQHNRIPCIEVGKQRFRSLASDTTTQGVVAIVNNKKYIEVADILAIAKKRDEPPFVLILDEIEDPHNLGALIRTAECGGIHGVVIPKHHAASVNQTVSKTSAGASEHMPVARVTNIANCIDELKQLGLWIVGTDPSVEKTYYEIDYSTPVALVVGNEGRGIRHLLKEKCDFLAKIPVYGKIQSLNASVAGALVIYEAVKQRKRR